LKENPQYQLLDQQSANWDQTQAFTITQNLLTKYGTKVKGIWAANDAMALGARKAFQDLPDNAARERWLSIPYIGCDGLPKTGQAWVKRGLLAASVFVPPNVGRAMEMLVHAVNTGTMPPERTLTVPASFPSLEALASARAEKARVMSV